MKNKKYPFIVIGAGVSGMTAAIYLKRSGHDVLLLEQEIPGGQINRTAEIENYPGFLKIDGPTFAMNIYQQIQNLKIPISFEKVHSVLKNNEISVITNKNEYICNQLIIASGRNPRHLEIENEEKYIGRGISYCALCDGAFFKNQIVAVVGSGNSALEEALYLAKICKKVIMLNRSLEFKGSKLLYDKLKKCDNVSFLFQTHVIDVIGDGNQLTGVKIKQNDQEQTLSLNGLFVYVGSIPNTKFLEDLNIKMENGFIIADEHMCTNIEGIYACGDCIKKDVYQLTTAVGDGAIAATTAEKRE